MDLSTLAFKADTTELERARKVVKELVNDFSKFDKSMQSSARLQAQTEQLLARAAKEQASARKENAKAADIELRSAIAAEKADQSREKSIKRSTKATEDNTKAAKQNVDILQRQQDILDFLAAGYSKGQAGILATAKATGQLSGELKKVLEMQKQFTSDTFDHSETGLKRMLKASKEAADAQKYLNQGFNLTSKQAKELSNDLSRLELGLKSQGKTYQEITKAQEVYKQQFVDEATALNKANAALSVVEKGRLDAANATKYFTLEDQKMAAALGTSNAAFDKAGSDKIVKYEQALIKSGLAQDVVTKKLATYKGQLAQVQAAEEKRAAANLTRAISPQLTDIAVSLYSGQAPLTVLLQQGGQLADIFRLSGVEAGNLGKLMKDSFYSMIPVIKEVGLALGGLATGMLMDLGRGTVKAIADFTGMSFAVEKLKQAIASGGEQNFKYIGSINKLGNALSVVATVGIVAVITALIAMGLEYKKIIQQESELSVALATSGGAMAMSKDQAVAYAEGMKAIGVSTLKAMDGIAEFAKAGKIGKEGLDLIIKSALDLEKYAGVSISETAKQYAKLQDEPTKALIDIAEKTGLVNKETLDLVRNLEQQGDKAEAAKVATEALTAANNAMSAEIKANLSPIETLWNDIKKAIGAVKQELYDLTTAEANVKALTTIFQTLAVIASEVWFTFKGVGKEIGGIAAQVASMDIGVADFANPAMLTAKIAKGFFSETSQSIRKDMVANAELDRKNHDAQIARIMSVGEQQKKNFSDSKEQNSAYAAWTKDNEKALERQYSKEERLGQKKKQLQADVTAGIIDETKAKEALAGWERIIMGEKKPKQDKQPAKDLEREIDILNKAAGLTATYNNDLESLQRRREKGLLTEDDYIHAVEELIKIQPFYIAQQKEINDAHELSNRLLGKQQGLGASYYKDLEAIAKYEKMGAEQGGYSAAQAEKLRQALAATTPIAKEIARDFETWNKNAHNLFETNQKDLAEMVKMNSELDLREAVMGKTTEEAKKITREYARQGDLTKVELELQKKLRDIQSKFATGDIDIVRGMQAMEDAENIAAEKRKAINREVAVEAAEDYYNAFKDIENGVTDSIVTALFEGGKAGSQKIRNVIINELRKPVTLVVQALVNTVLGSVIGSVAGGAASSAAGSLIGNTAMGAAGSALSGLVPGLSTISGVFNGFTTAATGAIQSMLGFTGTAAQMTTSLVTAGHTAAAGMSTGMQIFNALPGWGWALAGVAAIGSLFSKKSTPHTGGAAISDANGTRSLDIVERNIGFASNRDNTIQSNVSTLATGINATLMGLANLTGSKSKFSVATGFADDSSKDGAWGSLVIKRIDGTIEEALVDWENQRTEKWAPKVFANGEEGYKQYLNSLTQGTITAIKSMELPEWVTRIVNTLGDSATTEEFDRALQSIREYPNTLLQSLGTTRDALVGEFVKGLQEGDAAKAGQNVADLLISSMEQSLLGNAAGQIIDIMNVGIITPIVDSLIAGATITEAIGAASIQQSLERARAVAQAFSVIWNDPEFKSFLETFRTSLGAGLGDLGSSLNYTQRYTYGVNENSQAADDATESTKGLTDAQKNLDDIESKRLSLLEQAYNLQGDENGLRAVLLAKRELEIKTLDSNLHSLQRYVWALEDQKAALDASTKKLNLEKQLYTLQKDDAAVRQVILDLRENEIQGIDKNLQAIQRNIWALEDQRDAQEKVNAAIKSSADLVSNMDSLAQAASDKAYEALERAVEAEREKAEASLDAAQEVKDNLSSIFDLLKDNVRELYQEVDSTAKMLSAQGRAIIQGAIATGVMPKEKDLTDAIGSVRDDLEGTSYATKYDQDRARLLFANELSALKEAAGEQLTEAEQQLKAAKDQVEYLDKVLKVGKEQLDALRGVDTSIIDLSKAIELLSIALGVEYKTALNGQKKTLYGSGGASYDVASGAGVASNGAAFTKEGILAGFNAHMAAGGSLADAVAVLASGGFTLNQIEDMYGSTRGSLGAVLDANGIPRFAGGGMHSGGLAITSENGPELINFGGPAQIYTAQETKAIMQGGTGASSSNTYELQAIAIQSARTARTVDRLEKIIDRLVQPGNDGIDALNVRTVN